MPHLNRDGEWCAGEGGNVVAARLRDWPAPRIVIPHQAGSARWIGDDLVIGQHCGPSGCHLVTWDRRTPDADPVEVSPHGAQHISTGGGEWAAWLDGVGLFTSTGLVLPDAGAGTMGPDGAVAFKVRYQSGGGFDVIERDGRRWRLTDGDAINITLLGNGRAVWSEPGYVLRSRGVPVPHLVTPTFDWLRVLEVDGVLWVLYQAAGGRLLFHPADDVHGHVIAPSGNAFNPDAVRLPNGLVRVVWALGPAEAAQDVRTSRDLDLAVDPRVDMRAPVDAPPAPVPPVPAPRPPMNVPMFTISTPAFPLRGEAPFVVACVATLEPGAGAADWFAWEVSTAGRYGPWRADGRPHDGPLHVYEFHPGEYWVRARAGNAAGEWETRAERKVTVAATVETPAPPAPEPPASADRMESLPSYDDFIKVEGPQLDAAYGRKPNLAAAARDAWRRLNENWSHANILRDVRRDPRDPVVGLVQRQRLTTLTYHDWEHTEAPAILAAQGKYATAGGVRHNAWRRFMEGMSLVNILHGIRGEPAEAPPAPLRRPARTGAVRGEGRNYADDGGTFFPLGASFFTALWMWEHDQPRARANFQFLKDRQCDDIRGFCEVGGPSWEDRTIDPRDDDYESNFIGMLEALYGDYDMRFEPTIFAGGSGADPDLVTDKVLNVIAGREHMIVDVEGANEAFQNFKDHDLLRRQVRKIRDRFPGLVASSSQEAWQESGGVLDEDITNLLIWHTAREYGDGGWRAVRQPWDAKGFRYPGSNGEPPGLQSSVSMLFDPLRMVMLRAIGIMCGMTRFVMHTGAGVRGGGAADLATGKPYLPRKANLYDYGDQWDAIWTPLRALDRLLPADLPNWRKTRHGWDDHPLRTDDIWPDGIVDHGVVRIHAAYSGGQFVVMPFGVKHYADLRAKDACRITVTDPLTGAVVDARTLHAGEVYRLAGANDVDASAAYIITGER